MVAPAKGNWGVHTTEPEKVVTAPSTCPFCQSTAVSVPPKHDASTY